MQPSFVSAAPVRKVAYKRTTTCKRQPKWRASSSWNSSESWDNTASYQQMGNGNPSKGLQTLKFVIRQDGTVEETVTGVRGASCEQVTKRIEEALGKVVHSKKTEEYFETPFDQNVVNDVTQETEYWPGADNLPTW